MTPFSNDTYKEAFNSFFEQTGDYVLVLKPGEKGSLVILDANTAALDKHGYFREEFIGKKIDLFNEGRQSGEKDLLQKIMSGEQVNFQVVRTGKDGTTFPLQASAKLIDIDGRPLIFSIERDLPVQRPSAELLNAKTARYETFFSSMLRGVAHHEIICDDQGRPVNYRFLEVNPAFENMTGLKAENLIGKTILEVLPNTEQYWIETYGKVALTGEPVSFQNYSSELNKYFDVTVYCPAEKQFVCIFKDITNYKQAEEDLARTAQRLSAYIDNSPLAVVEFDPKFRVTRWSKEAKQVFGWSSNEIQGKTIAEMHWVHKEDKERVVRESEGLITGRRPLSLCSNRNYRKDGKVIHCEWYNSGIYDSNGKLVSVLSLVLDVTGRKEAENARQELETRLRQTLKMEAVGTMAGGIAHEFNNILAIILGNTELAIDDIPPGNPARQDIEEILSASLRAKDLLRKLMIFSRKEKTELLPIMPSTVINETVQLLRYITPATVSIDEYICEACGPIKADWTQLHQLMMNLLSNALYAMDEKGKITISLNDVMISSQEVFGNREMKPGFYVRLSITDTGTGMDQDTVERIFDPFYTTKGIDQSIGMGLSVVHGIVEGHSGFISIESEPGKGSTFHIFFPVLDGEVIDDGKTAEQKPVTAALSGTARILFVDDEASLLTMVKRSLEAHGYQVTTEISSVKALEIFKSNPEEFDLVITDQAMPDMSGLDLIEEILKIRQGIPIILCTGYSSKVSEKDASIKGISRFISKPCSKEYMLEAIEAVLGQ